MFIQDVSLQNFRNLNQLKISLEPGVNIFYGQNAQGKTNILESIYLCATGRSQRAKVDKEMICFGEKECHIQTKVCRDSRIERIDVHLKKEEKKGIALNGIPIKKLGDLFGALHVVIFSPEDLKLLKNGPSERRKFMDMEICQLNPIYYYELQQYYKILKQRNHALKSAQKNKSLIETIFVWDEQLINFGERIIEKRMAFVGKMSVLANQIHGHITGNGEVLKVEYNPDTPLGTFASRLKKHLDKDLLYGTTNVGIHKDDLNFYINDVDVKTYGSQGQTRTAALSMKLSEIELIKQEKLTMPVVLLDDVLSELDGTRQRFLLENMKDVQMMITCTGLEDTLKYTQNQKVFYVENGQIMFSP